MMHDMSRRLVVGQVMNLIHDRNKYALLVVDHDLQALWPLSTLPHLGKALPAVTST